MLANALRNAVVATIILSLGLSFATGAPPAGGKTAEVAAAKPASLPAFEALQPVATATTVRQRNGKTLTIDGPFAETKEQLGGFDMVEAKDLDEAIKLAGGIPAVRTGSIEVRPIMPTPPPE